MIEEVAIRILRAVFGGGSDISAANPLPVDTSPGLKVATTILDEAAIAAATTTTLADCTVGGTHTAAVHLTIMTDAAAHFIVDELVGLRINNVTDGSSGLITANTETTVTVAALAGGALNQWSTGDAYTIVGAALNLSDGPATLALTVKARYDVAAVQGIRVHVITSPSNSATGTHTAVAHATIMTDAAAHFIVDELIGLTIVNVTDGSSGVITDNDETTVTVAALAGGTLNQWSLNDVYSIAGADYDTEDWDVWNPAFAANAVLRQTKHYDVSPYAIKVLVENLDAAPVTDVLIIATVGV